MKSHSEQARRHLDARFQQIPRWDLLARPQKGWLRAIRDALGMTAEQVAQRLGVSKPRISTMEKDELRGALTLATLEKAAQAMGCRFVYAIVPEESLQALVEKQARRQASAILKRTSHTMGLEQQGVGEQEREAQLLRLASDLLAKESSQLWNEP
jgi:predicted DNA-binding mobile mystery protein A